MISSKYFSGLTQYDLAVSGANVTPNSGCTIIPYTVLYRGQETWRAIINIDIDIIDTNAIALYLKGILFPSSSRGIGFSTDDGSHTRYQFRGITSAGGNSIHVEFDGAVDNFKVFGDVELGRKPDFISED